ncbi:MAG TPA: 2OG-Fe(II) oxygenase [Pyrinomonadaceae bacterium]|nr:2OG-Fe(II) oxygenase [Pyrinomonadaceae bacterium]
MSGLSASHFNLFLLQNFLDAKTCGDLIGELVDSPTTQAPVYIQGSDSTLHEDVRKTTSLHPSAETITHVHTLLLAQKSALAAHFGLSLTDCELPQFLRYQPGDFFVRHQDGNTDTLDFDHLRIRKISLIAFLNNHAAEPQENCFSGGALTFYDKRDADAESFPLTGEMGLLVGFRADTYHEVLPVTSGDRFTIISWFR